jgi:hypothetical protein
LLWTAGAIAIFRVATRDQVIILAGIPWNPGTT